MKKITAIGLIVLMSFQCLYNLGTIAYFELNRKYISEVLCINKDQPALKCNGQCFLKNRLQLDLKTASNEPSKPVEKARVEFPVFLLSEFVYRFSESQPGEWMNGPGGLPSSAHNKSLFRPPCVS